VPDGFWFVSFVVVGLLVASEWARRLAVRGMRSPPNELDKRRVGARRPSRARRTDQPRGARVVVLRPILKSNEVVAIPQWQKDP
jgi:hypothetical protein